jgi:N6-L-threonylcarbamoyladenine synthase
MYILAIETSCDDTSVAIVENGRHVHALHTHTQAFHQAAYGGVVPEVASRSHLDAMADVLHHVATHYPHAWAAVDAIAATLGPGLVGSLLVGATTAKTMAWALGKPFIGVNHLAGHLASVYLNSDVKPPYLALLVSGGHTQLWAVRTYTDRTLLGQTCDDAAGEVFDKVARFMDIPNGGAGLAQLADTLPEQDKIAVPTMPIARTQQPYDFSFSGLKTHMLRQVEAVNTGKLQASAEQLAAGFQYAGQYQSHL